VVHVYWVIPAGFDPLVCSGNLPIRDMKDVGSLRGVAESKQRKIGHGWRKTWQA
jgi:hypothetical protein